MDNVSLLYENEIVSFLKEDGWGKNFFYEKNIPHDLVECELKIKSDCIVAGLPFFAAVFGYLNQSPLNLDLGLEGQFVRAQDKKSLKFKLPFHVALAGERLSLNLLSRTSAVATYTEQFVKKASPKNIAILDTRKTTPGLKTFEKYGVRVGGGVNHRFESTEILMIKDNHKSFYGGIEKAIKAFREIAGFYAALIVEIHSIDELKKAIDLEVKHVMLDNFSPELIQKAVLIKPKDMTYEVSGGIDLTTIDQYLINGVDAISIGKLTHNPPPIDFSLKMRRA